MFKELRLLLTIIGVFFILPCSIKAMESEDLSSAHGVTVRPAGIEVPSDPAQVGFKAPSYLFPETRRSWQDLSSFTQQTLHNFQNNIQRGILFVHSLEDILEASKCFAINWNNTYTTDQREFQGNTFHTVFSHEVFVNHYIRFIMAPRVIISGSIIALHDDPAFNLTSTFSPVNFILDVPPECIIVTEHRDASPGLHYATLHGPYTNQFEDLAKRAEKIRITLDSLVRFPTVTDGCTGHFWNMMNEVAIASCAQEGEKVFRPRVVGVLINKTGVSPGFDYGNGVRNIQWRRAAKNFANSYHIPYLKLNDDCTSKFDKTGAQRIVKEWSNDKTDHFEELQARTTFLTKEEQQLRDEFRQLLNERLKDVLDEDRATVAKEIGKEIVRSKAHFEPAFRILFEGNPYVQREKKFLLSDQQLKGYVQPPFYNPELS